MRNEERGMRTQTEGIDYRLMINSYPIRTIDYKLRIIYYRLRTTDI